MSSSIQQLHIAFVSCDISHFNNLQVCS